MNQLIEDGKIKTIRCIKATHEDFEKLVNMGKKVIKEISDMEKKTNTCSKKFIDQTEKGEKKEPFYDKKITQMELYKFYIEKEIQLETYKNIYKELMEEGVDELLFSIEVKPESYHYNFYELCLEN